MGRGKCHGHLPSRRKGIHGGLPPATRYYFADYSFFYSGEASGKAAKGIALGHLGNLNIEGDVTVKGTAHSKHRPSFGLRQEKSSAGILGSAPSSRLGGRRST